MDQKERRQLDNRLMKMGLAKLNDPQLFPQLGFLVQGHKHFGELLRACEPEKRTDMYEALRPHLGFKPMALDRYLMAPSSIILTDTQ
jgi:hypothetical protein